jgi:hypothetical protein
MNKQMTIREKITKLENQLLARNVSPETLRRLECFEPEERAEYLRHAFLILGLEPEE